MKTKKKPVRKSTPAALDPAYARVVNAFARDKAVTLPSPGKGFGSGGLKVGGKLFAMMSSKGNFVVKLPKERVDALVAADKGAYFDPGHGRLMKEWLEMKSGQAQWIKLAKEAREFVARK
jgi:hypothetical protein